MSVEKANGKVTRGLVRQGDVLLVPVDEVPGEDGREAEEGSRFVLAEGEATGHAHVVEGRARLYRPTSTGSNASRSYIVVEEPASLVHDEHDTIGLAPGAYEVRRQREYTPPATRRRETFRWVAD